MRELELDEDLRRVLAEARTVAVLGAHSDQTRPAWFVPGYLHQHGYRILPVNPGQAGTALHDQPVRSSLTDLGEPVDVVDVFRRGEALPGHVDEILAMQPRPKVVWLQLGVRNDSVAAQLVAAGIEVVQDRCMMAEHRRLIR